MRSLTCVVLLFVAFSLIAVSPAQQASTTSVPNLINYNGTLVLSNGPGVPAKTVGVTFAIYGQQDGGAPIWLETQNVTPDSTGHYTVLLGSTKAEGVPTDLFSTQGQRWLGVQVQGEAEQPRVLLVSVPYAMKAGDAETVGGLPPSAFVQKPSPSEQANESPVSAGGVMAPGRVAPIGGSGTTNFIPIWTSSTNLGNSTIYETGGNVGIGTTYLTSMLTVAGSIGASTYQIGGQNVLSAPCCQNLFLGYQAGNGSGRANTFLGTIAGEMNTTGADNTFVGARAGVNNTSGDNNTFMGFVTGYNNSVGSQNVFIGNGAGRGNTTGQNNTMLGWGSGAANVSGTDNVYVGYTAGHQATGNNNIYIGEVSTPLSENNTIRIGGSCSQCPCAPTAEAKS